LSDHPILKHPQRLLFLECMKPRFTSAHIG
jgi:hypothetical protein